MADFIIKNAQQVNEGKITEGDLLVKSGRIERIDPSIDVKYRIEEIDAEGLLLSPGVIDDQVHFREPGLTHKADIASESRAAVAGGVTSFMEMPNTKPAAFTRELLEEKYSIASRVSPANYSFFIGASNDNLDELLSIDIKKICGIKIFMGSSTGNLLVDDPQTLENIFKQAPTLIATHCEDEKTIRRNLAEAKEKYPEDIGAYVHPLIRNVEGCYLSSSMAVELAEKHNTRLHILHISTAKELELFSNNKPLSEKRITAEVCVHHLWFNDSQYEQLGNKIKCNPAIKSAEDQAALWKALIDDRLDIIATDHAPHTIDEKSNLYFEAPSGLPLVQHPLVMMLEKASDGEISLEQVIHKMCHAPAICFQVKDRGFLREGYHADLVLIDPNKPYTISKDNILFKCGWSPLEGKKFKHSIHSTFVNGERVFSSENGLFEGTPGERLLFSR